jgi:hypothetical protein
MKNLGARPDDQRLAVLDCPAPGQEFDRCLRARASKRGIARAKRDPRYDGEHEGTYAWELAADVEGMIRRGARDRQVSRRFFGQRAYGQARCVEAPILTSLEKRCALIRYFAGLDATTEREVDSCQIQRR